MIRTVSSHGNPAIARAHSFGVSNAGLWTAQVALAALFLFAGVMKLVLPVEDITGDTGLPGAFMRFIGVCETLGGIGVIAPALLRFGRLLTSLAAAGLVMIMIGATVTTVVVGPAAGAVLPFAVGLVAAAVAYGRRAWTFGPAMN